jgi:uncharacterized membrane protein YciS (DUF1049 family)
MSRDPWYRRFLDNPPILSDRAWALTLMALLVVIGIILGLMLCGTGQLKQSSELTRLLDGDTLMRLRLDTLEQRIKALEAR